MPDGDILLLNPPWEKPYFRDLYCSASTKASYIWQPTDLLVLSGIVSREYSVRVIDAIAEDLSFDEALHRALETDLKAVIFLIASGTEDQDLRLVAAIKEKQPRVKLIANGGVALYQYQRLLEENPYLDGILFDFTAEDILHFLRDDWEPIENMAFRNGDSIECRGPTRRRETFTCSLPRHDLFPEGRYRIPGGTQRRFASVLTSYGCARNCSFCTYTNSELGYKTRELTETIEELRHLKGLGYKEFFLRDASFVPRSRHARELCQAMIEAELGLGWMCNARVDAVDEPSLRMIRDAGCHTVYFGVESGDDEILSLQKKGTTTEQVRSAFRLCSQLGIRTGAFFIFGLIGETVDTMQKTIDFAKELDCYIASFNIAMPLEGTDLRKQAVAEGRLPAEMKGMDISSFEPIALGDELSPALILRYKQKAIREFYLRPRYLWERLRKTRSTHEVLSSVIDGFALIKSSVMGQAAVTDVGEEERHRETRIET